MLRLDDPGFLVLEKETTLVVCLGGRTAEYIFMGGARVAFPRYYRHFNLTSCWVHTHEGWSRALHIGRLRLTRRATDG